MTARLGGLLATVGVTIGFLLLMFGGGLWVGIYVSDIRLALVLYGGGACIVWLVVALLRPRWLPHSALTGAFAASLVAFAVSGAVAWQPRLGFDNLAYAVLLTALYLMLVRVWADGLLARRLYALVVVVTAASAILYVYEVGSSWVDYWQLIGGFAVPPLRPGYAGLWLGNPNALASLLVLLYLTVAAAAGPGRWRRVALVALGLLVAFDVLLSGSRGAWLGVGLAAVVGGGVWLLSGGNRARLLALASQPRARVGIAAGVVVTAVATVLFAPAIIDRLQAGAVESRTAFWAATLRMIEARPLTGLGPGSWAPARIPYTVAPELDTYVPHAHNVPLQVASEFGIVGIVAGVIVVLLLARLIRRGLRHATAETRAFGWATLLGAVYLFGQSLVDAYIHQPAILLALALPIARLDALVTADEPAPHASVLLRRRVLALTLLGAVMVSTLAAAGVEPAARELERAVAAANAGDWQTALAESNRAASSEPNLAPDAFMAGLAAAHMGDLDTAAAQLERAALLDDYAPAWLDLAAVRLRLGDDDGARIALARALRLGYRQPPIAAAAAGVYRELGDLAAAREALASAFAVVPSLASDPFWQSTEWTDLAAAARADAQAQLGESWDGFLLALELDDGDRAAMIANTLGGVEGVDAQLASQAWQGDDEAFADLHARARARPLDGRVASLCRRVAEVGRARGRPSWSCDGAAPTDAYPVIRVGDPLPDQVMRGRELYFHAPYGYRRVLPQNLLVPFVLQLSARNP